MTSRDEALGELQRRRAKILEQGGPAKVAAQHAKGRLSARERVALLFDPGTFREIGMFAHSDRHEVGENAAADGVVTGMGCVDGRRAVVVAIDVTVFGGSNGRIGLRKQGHMNYLAETKGVPLIVLGDASGGRMPDMLDETFAEVNGLFEGEAIFGLRYQRVRIPRVTAILGNSYGDPSFYAAASDFVAMRSDGSIGLSGPPVVAGAIGAQVSDAELAGPDVAAKGSGIAHLVLDDDEACIAAVRTFLSYLPSNDTAPTPVAAEWDPPLIGPDEVSDEVPVDFRRAYDIHSVISAVVDGASFFEMRRDFGRAVVAGLARVEGRSVLIVANQPKYRAGVADADAIIKTRDAVRLAEAFGLPIVFLQDLPGVMVGPDSERAGILKYAIDLLRAVTTATVPRVTVVLRKAYGFGWVLYGGYPSGADYVVAWPDAQINFMAPSTGSAVVNRRRLDEVREREGEEAYKALAAQLAAEMNKGSEVWRPAGRAAIHAVIDPSQTRQAVIDGIFIGDSSIPRDRRSQVR
jgi:acetyl-CoA carboxylase carboxyltransferase component